jgi:hypothetical protein
MMRDAPAAKFKWPFGFWALVAVAIVILLVAIGVMISENFGLSWSGRAGHASLTVASWGSENCIGCHRAEGDLWHNSQPWRAIDHAGGVGGRPDATREGDDREHMPIAIDGGWSHVRYDAAMLIQHAPAATRVAPSRATVAAEV